MQRLRFLARVVPLMVLLLFVLERKNAFGKQISRIDPQKERSVKVGAEVLLDRHLDTLRKHRVGLVMNPTARVDGVHMLDTLLALDVPVKALFAPEHGFSGRAAAGEKIENGIHKPTGLPIYSLYGDTKVPTPQMLKKVELLLFDIQDVGARFYTYNVTLGNVIEAASRQNIPVWILDRPNPAGGEYMAGWRLRKQHRSFVGQYPIPVVHGMTLGELALMMVGENWINSSQQAEVRVIRMKNWDRQMQWPETGLTWYPPSPNLPHFGNALFYLGTAFFEGTSLSEGRGTRDPFRLIGAPKFNLPDSAVKNLESLYPVNIRKTRFTPQSLPHMAPNPEYEGQQLKGIRLRRSDSLKGFSPLAFGLELLKTILRYNPEVKLNDHMTRLAGTRQIYEYLKSENAMTPEKSWQKFIQQFRQKRRPYLLYPPDK